MSTPADTLSQMIAALTEESSKARRRTHANAAYAALCEMREAMPPANAEEAERRGYEGAMLRALEILKAQQDALELPLRQFMYDTQLPVVGALNDARLHADRLVRHFERAVMAELRPSAKKTP